MSHIAEVDLEIKDLEALKKACTKLGLELVEGQTTYKWFGRLVGDYPIPQGLSEEDLGKCEHAIRIPGNSKAYEIGIIKSKDGKEGYTLLWDFWNGGYGMQQKVGQNGDMLKQTYATEVTSKALIRQGFRFTKTVNDQNEVVFVAHK